MSDAGPSAVQPTNGAAAEPAADLSDDALLEQAIGAMQVPEDGEEKPASVPKAPAPKQPEQKMSEDELEKMAIGLTAKARRLRERSEKFQDEVRVGKSELEAARAEFEKTRASHTALLEQAKTSPLAALESLGWTFEDLNAYVMSEGTIPYEKRMREIESKFDEKLNAKAKEIEEQKQTLARQQLVTQAEKFKVDAERNVNALLGSGVFPLAAKMAQAEGEDFLWTVLGSISSAYQQSGGKKVLAPKDVLEQIEARLIRQVKILTDGDPGRAGSVKPLKPEAGKEPRTLTNELGAERAVRPSQDDEDLDDEKLLERAIAAVTGG